MTIEKLNHHYSFTNPASIYDEEALTALELAGRTAAKMNEVVDDQNALRQETESHLKAQDETIDARMASQDAYLEKINHVTVPAVVNDEMDERIEDGTFDDKINFTSKHVAKDLILSLNKFTVIVNFVFG